MGDCNLACSFKNRFAISFLRMYLCSVSFFSLRPLKGPFTLTISIKTAISFLLICLDFLINQVGHSKNRLQPQLIRCDTSIDTDAPNQSLKLSATGLNWILIYYLLWRSYLKESKFLIVKFFQTEFTLGINVHVFLNIWNSSLIQFQELFQKLGKRWESRIV